MALITALHSVQRISDTAANVEVSHVRSDDFIYIEQPGGNDDGTDNVILIPLSEAWKFISVMSQIVGKAMEMKNDVPEYKIDYVRNGPDSWYGCVRRKDGTVRHVGYDFPDWRVASDKAESAMIQWFAEDGHKLP